MLTLIQNVADEDKRIRAVLLNGSRANSNAPKDRYQDFDIIYIVTSVDNFRAKPNWIDVFGERMILQMPNTMDLGSDVNPPMIDAETYLMIFKDTNRIDLTLVALNDRFHLKDSLTKVLLDKDQLYPNLAPSSDVDYWVKKPTEKQFLDCCNEFWWVSTYVIKGLLRNEIIYAKDRMEKPVRDMLMKMLSWYVGVHHNFTIN
ncbi:MAG: aminoglycoside 6-adenylyltransferase, partial [Chitinophagales bacterium]